MIHERATPRALGLARACVFGLWTLYLLTDHLERLSIFPVYDFTPVGVLRLLPREAWPPLLGAGPLLALRALSISLCSLAMLGIGPYRVIAAGCAVVLTFEQGLTRSFFFPNHGEIGPLMLVYALALLPADRGFRWRRVEREDDASAEARAGLLLLAAMLLAPYWAIGTNRLTHTGMDMFLEDSLPSWFVGYTYGQTWYGLALAEPLLQHPGLVALAKAGFAGVTVLEALAPLCLASTPFRWVWLAVVAPFHAMCVPLMDIFFWQNVLLMPVLLLDVTRWVSRPAGRAV